MERSSFRLNVKEKILKKLIERMLMSLLVLVAVILVVHVEGTMQPLLSNLKSNIVTDFDRVAFDLNEKTALNHYQVTGNYTTTKRPYSAFVATFPASRFAFYPPTSKGCTGLYKTSISSVTEPRNCAYATNGAFFTWDTSLSSNCIGNLVSDGQVWQLPTDGSGTGRANFGITTKNEIFTGFIDSNVIAQNNFTQLITGWGWLVRNGESNVKVSQDLSYQPGGFTLEKAPRTAVGAFSNGTMILVEIDGEEDIEYGPDLFEVADLLVTLGVHTAVNIDGGGSSVSVAEGKVVSVPTCNDTPEVCERAVASFTCVKAV